MKLYAMPGTCALAPNIALHWAGSPFEVVNLKRGDNKKPDYLAIHPRGQVPALVMDDGGVLTEATAILLYAGDRYPDARLAGDGLLARARVAEALSYMTSEVHADFGPHFAAERFAGSEACQNEVKRRAYAKLGEHYERLEATVIAGGGRYTGERTAADAYLYVLVRWLPMTPLEPGAYPALKAFREEMEEDPEVQAALKTQGMTG